jgi:DnaJ-class molecular chaperone
MASELVEETRALLEKRYEAATAGDYFGVLGIDDTAGSKQVQDNYFKLAKLLHPDKITASGEFNDDDRQKALQVFKFATEAKDVLADKALRANCSPIGSRRGASAERSASRAKTRSPRSRSTKEQSC